MRLYNPTPVKTVGGAAILSHLRTEERDGVRGGVASTPKRLPDGPAGPGALPVLEAYYHACWEFAGFSTLTGYYTVPFELGFGDVVPYYQAPWEA